jgi:hypothetical protein
VSAVNAPVKEIEVDLKEIGCPYPAEDERTLVWLDGYRAGNLAGMDAGAKAYAEAYEQALLGAKP